MYKYNDIIYIIIIILFCRREHYPFVWTSLEPYYNTYVARFLIDAVSTQALW
jgi:hypothetical protein